MRVNRNSLRYLGDVLSRVPGALFAFVVVVFLAAPPVLAAPVEKKVALIIGNARYEGAPLKNPVNDARAIAVKLKALGFETLLRENATQKEMSRAVTLFGEKLGQGAQVGLFYYAGHGIQSRGKNYLIPTDAQITSEAAVRSEAVDVDALLEQLNNSPLNIVILDACRNNPFERRFRSAGGGGLAQMEAPKGTLIAYATAPGRVALDGEGKNGVYTAELLRTLDEPGLKVEDVFKRVRAAVARVTADQQMPWESSSLTGDFYFRAGGKDAAVSLGGGAAATSAAAASAATEAAVELAFWESAERGNQPADYAAYLKRYPEGQFAELARNRVAKPAGGAKLAALSPAATPITREAPAAQLELKLGEQWAYRGSNSLGPDAPVYRVTRVDAGLAELSFRSNNNDDWVMVVNRDGNTVSMRGPVDMKFLPFVPHVQFPLEPGKKWRLHYKTDCGFLCSLSTDLDGEVRGWERVTVPAGTFEAVRIDYREHSSAGTAVGSIWYAPEVKRPVRHEQQLNNMRHYYELESFQLVP